LFCEVNRGLRHVYDVEISYGNGGRVLRPGGNLYLAAPNYVWPERASFENMVVLPLLGKPLLQILRRASRKTETDRYFSGSFTLVTPWKIERSISLPLAYRRANIQQDIKALRVWKRSEACGSAYTECGPFVFLLTGWHAKPRVVSLAISVGVYPKFALLREKSPLPPSGFRGGSAW